MTPSSDTLDRMFHALADPHRRNMVDRLSRGPASVKELAQPFNLPLPSALKHLGVLEAGGIVLSEKVGRVRTFRIQPAALGTLEDWVAARKLDWSRTFDRLDQLMAEYPEDPDK